VAGMVFQTVLKENLNATQLDHIRAAVLDHRYPPEADVLLAVADILHRQDDQRWPEMCLALVETPLAEADPAGDPDVFPISPPSRHPGSGFLGLDQLGAEGISEPRDPRLAPVVCAALGHDPFNNSDAILGMRYLAAMPTDESAALAVELLDSANRMVAGMAASLAGKRRIEAAVPGLRRLVASPSPRLRAIAADALRALGESPPADAAGSPGRRAENRQDAPLVRSDRRNDPARPRQNLRR
jgi:hypothetical protein